MQKTGVCPDPDRHGLIFRRNSCEKHVFGGFCRYPRKSECISACDIMTVSWYLQNRNDREAPAGKTAGVFRLRIFLFFCTSYIENKNQHRQKDRRRRRRRRVFMADGNNKDTAQKDIKSRDIREKDIKEIDFKKIAHYIKENCFLQYIHNIFLGIMGKALFSAAILSPSASGTSSSVRRRCRFRAYRV